MSGNGFAPYGFVVYSKGIWADADWRTGTVKIFVVDDYIPVLNCVAAMLGAMGHSVVTFSDPRLAVASLTADVDLVLVDINMPEMDGFEVARLAAAKLGQSPPRTLLMSGEESRAAEVARCPPSTVIGILAKPFDFAGLARVVGLVAETRSCCPGKTTPYADALPHACGKSHGGESPADQEICFTRDYACCPSYAAHCGQAFRKSIQGD